MSEVSGNICQVLPLNNTLTLRDRQSSNPREGVTAQILFAGGPWVEQFFSFPALAVTTSHQEMGFWSPCLLSVVAVFKVIHFQLCISFLSKQLVLYRPKNSRHDVV